MLDIVRRASARSRFSTIKSTIETQRGQLVAVALPKRSRGLVWRIARMYNASVVRQVSEANVGATVVLVFKATAPAGRFLRSDSLAARQRKRSKHDASRFVFAETARGHRRRTAVSRLRPVEYAKESSPG